MREIPSGQLSTNAAVLFITGSGALFIFAAAMLGKLCFYLSFPVLALLLLYSYTKRFTWLCHLYLGFVISLAPIGAWVALTDTISLSVIILSLALMTNICGFDILYACQDTEFDKDQGLFSVPARVGIKNALALSSYLHIATFFLFVLLSFTFDMGTLYMGTVLIIGCLLIFEHSLVKPDDLSNVNIAFFHVNSIISVVLFLGILLNEIVH